MKGGRTIFQAIFKDAGDKKDKRIADIDRTPNRSLVVALKAAAEERNDKANSDNKKQAAFLIEPISLTADTPESLNQVRLQLSDRVREKDLFAILEIGPDVLEPATGSAGPGERRAARYQSNSPLNQNFPRWAEKVLNH